MTPFSSTFTFGRLWPFFGAASAWARSGASFSRVADGIPGRGGIFSAPCPSSSAAHTEVLTAKDKVAAMSAPENKREYRAPNVAVMRCDFVGYMAEVLSVPHAKVTQVIIRYSYFASCRE